MSLGITDQQVAMWKDIIAETKKMGMPLLAAQIAIMTTMDEDPSADPTTPGDGGNSTGNEAIGLFQQHPSWGSLASREDPFSSSRAFLQRLRNVDYANMEPWQAAQAVQNSATSDGSNYQRFWQNGQAIATQLWNDPSITSLPALSATAAGPGGAGGPSNGTGSDTTTQIDWSTIGNVFTNPIVSPLGAIFGAATDVTGAIKAMAKIFYDAFQKLLWIANPTNFIKALLYVSGALCVGGGLWLIVTGAGLERPE